MKSPKIVILKYNAGNIRSVMNALNRLGYEAEITAEPERLRNADKIIFPGVGEAASTMKHLHETGLATLIPSLKQPVLGICLGMQLMCKYSEEGNVNCLNIFNSEVKKFTCPSNQVQTYKIPHMGWNAIKDLKGDLFHPTLEESFTYFVHSYYVPLCEHTTATTDYIIPFSAALQKENFFATQFHPEKSGDIGEQILKNFLEL